jgi:hypothetical protein
VSDIYATAIDYNPKAEITREFFATVQKKMHHTAHKHTAAEVIYERVNDWKPMVGMINFNGGYITKDDVKVAKNYLSERELQVLNLLVSQFLDYAELQALEERAMTMSDWIASFWVTAANRSRARGGCHTSRLSRKLKRNLRFTAPAKCASSKATSTGR